MIRTPNTTNNKQEKSNTHIHYRSHSLLSTYTVIQGGGVKLALTSRVSEVMRSQRYCHSWKGTWVFWLAMQLNTLSIVTNLTELVQKRLENTKGYSERVHRWRTDNTMAKRTGTKWKTARYKTLHRTIRKPT
jgi:hypothetical protein